MLPHFDSCYIISYNESTIHWFYTVKTIVYLLQKKKDNKTKETTSGGWPEDSVQPFSQCKTEKPFY